MYPQFLGATNNKENDRQLQRFERQLGPWARLLGEDHLLLKIKTRRGGCLPNVQKQTEISRVRPHEVKSPVVAGIWGVSSTLSFAAGLKSGSKISDSEADLPEEPEVRSSEEGQSGRRAWPPGSVSLPWRRGLLCESPLGVPFPPSAIAERTGQVGADGGEDERTD